MKDDAIELEAQRLFAGQDPDDPVQYTLDEVRSIQRDYAAHLEWEASRPALTAPVKPVDDSEIPW